MKNLLYIIAFFCFVHIQAQEQIIPDPDLKVTKKNGMITVSLPDDNSYSITFPGDTVYRLEIFNFMVVVNKGKMGIIDPWDLYMVVKPVYSYVAPFDEASVLVRRGKKYSIVFPFEDGFDKEYFKIDTLYPLTPPGELVYNDMHMYILVNKGKYGIYNTWSGTEEFLPVKYDEIRLIASHDDGIVYKMRKGKKWGAGDCETYETKIIYDDIDWLTGSCANNYFRVKKDGRFGLVATYSYGEYVYPPEFDMVSFAGEYIGNGYFILKMGDKYDVADDTFPPFQPRYDNVWLMETDGLTRISMQAGDEISTIEIEY
ncbi:MAG: WG repeat-containing protein [Bacteroidales bacterium]|nr:WG repeat-containing protein [Bacteroidales bacterium]